MRAATEAVIELRVGDTVTTAALVVERTSREYSFPAASADARADHEAMSVAGEEIVNEGSERRPWLRMPLLRPAADARRRRRARWAARASNAAPLTRCTVHVSVTPAERLIEIVDRRLIPVQHPPFKASAPAFDGDAREVRHQPPSQAMAR